MDSVEQMERQLRDYQAQRIADEIARLRSIHSANRDATTRNTHDATRNTRRRHRRRCPRCRRRRLGRRSGRTAAVAAPELITIQSKSPS